MVLAVSSRFRARHSCEGIQRPSREGDTFAVGISARDCVDEVTESVAIPQQDAGRRGRRAQMSSRSLANRAENTLALSVLGWLMQLSSTGLTTHAR